MRHQRGLQGKGSDFMYLFIFSVIDEGSSMFKTKVTNYIEKERSKHKKEGLIDGIKSRNIAKAQVEGLALKASSLETGGQ